MRKKLPILIALLFAGTLLGWSEGDVVINELLWMGTSLSPYDEYVELRNMTAGTVDFSIEPWSIYREGEPMVLIDDGELAPNGYFLICRRTPSNSRIATPPDLIAISLALTNSNTQYKLYSGPDSTYPVLDVADDGVGAPLSGKFIMAEDVRWSMERDDPPGDGTIADSWHVACLTLGFVAGATERGTPGLPNYQNAIPIAPTSVEIEPAYIADDSSITANIYGAHDPDSLPRGLIAIFDWLNADTLISTTFDSTPPFESRLPESLTFPGRRYLSRIWVFDGTDSSETVFSVTVFAHFEKGDLIISELAWAGSMRSEDDEWIEIRNRSDRTVDFSRTPWHIKGISTISTEPVHMLFLTSGIIAPGELFIVSNFAESDSRCALAVAPDTVTASVFLRDDLLEIELVDYPGPPGAAIDVAGDGGLPFAGVNSPDDSTRYTMSRIASAGDGTDSASWFTSEVTHGYKAASFERGTPGTSNIRNNPPMLQWVGDSCYETDGLNPEEGTKDTFFVWRVKYSDADNIAPEYVRLLFDQTCDGDFDDTLETLDMYRENPADTNFADGVIYRKWRYNLHPTSIACPYTFRASDGLTKTGLDIPATPGPIVHETIRISFLGKAWRPDTIINEPTVITGPLEMLYLIHTGDVPVQVGMSIVEADIFPHSADTFAYSPGGWTFAEILDTAGINLYHLSALILPLGVMPDTGDFNDGAEDLLTGEIRWFDGDTLGRPSDSLTPNMLPFQIRRLAFRLDLPRQIYGFYSRWEHRITARFYVRLPLP